MMRDLGHGTLGVAAREPLEPLRHLEVEAAPPSGTALVVEDVADQWMGELVGLALVRQQAVADGLVEHVDDIARSPPRDAGEDAQVEAGTEKRRERQELATGRRQLARPNGDRARDR